MLPTTTSSLYFTNNSYAANSPSGSAIQSFVVHALRNREVGWLTVRVSYNTSAISGFTVGLLASQDGATWDTSESPYALFVFPFSANQTLQMTGVIDPLPPHLAVNMFNVDSRYAVGSVQVWFGQTRNVR